MRLTARRIEYVRQGPDQKYLHNPDFCLIFAHAKAIDPNLKTYRGMEQLAARRAHNPKVGGSSPPPATKTDNSKELSVFLELSGLESLYFGCFPVKVFTNVL